MSTKHQPEIACPHCQKDQGFTANTLEDGEQMNDECLYCFKPFLVTCHVIFTTERKQP